MKTNKVAGLFIRTTPGVKRFRRAGHAFNEQGVGIALDALSEAQIAAIKAEPKLLVEDVEVEIGVADTADKDESQTKKASPKGKAPEGDKADNKTEGKGA